MASLSELEGPEEEVVDVVSRDPCICQENQASDCISNEHFRTDLSAVKLTLSAKYANSFSCQSPS